MIHQYKDILYGKIAALIEYNPKEFPKIYNRIPDSKDICKVIPLRILNRIVNI